MIGSRRNQGAQKWKRSVFLSLGLGLGLLSLSGCALIEEKEAPPLAGERISVLELQRTIEPDSDALSAQGFVAPAAWRNEFWPQAGGYPNHAMQHLALTDKAPEKIWQASIGRGATSGLPLTAQPVVVNGRVFTLDTESQISAFNAKDGQRLWTQNVKPPHERENVIGGGIAYSQGVLYITTGYDELLAAHPDTGKIIWRVPLPAPVRAAPTIMENRIFVTTLDNRLLALRIDNGELLWDFTGISEKASLIGAASPAASREIVVPAFSSGELFALRVENGSVAWSDNLSGIRRIGGVSGLSDIRGLPVIDKGLVIAISFGGRLMVIDERTGERVWQREIGGAETPWVAGNHIFILSTDNELVALGRDNGVIRWVTKLPRYEDSDRRIGPIFWTGPVYAGGRLIVASSTGDVIEIAPETGKTIRTWKADGAVNISPVVAGGTLYLLSNDGQLSAYR